MSDLSSKKRDELVRELGWSLERAQGYLDGVEAQVAGQTLAPRHKVGMDDYAKGFRTGYYTQACSLNAWQIRDALVARQQ